MDEYGRLDYLATVEPIRHNSAHKSASVHYS